MMMQSVRPLPMFATRCFLVVMVTSSTTVVRSLPVTFDVLSTLQSVRTMFLNGTSEAATRFDKQPRFCPKDPDACRNVTELIVTKGYPAEEHSVTTADGFILALQRIPRGIKLRPRNNGSQLLTVRPVVFLQHGFADSAATWIMNGADQSLATILADAGFDVWLGNIRGSTYSVNHVALNTSDQAFWNWSWDEIQRFDLSAMIDYVLETTGQKQLDYVGHSQGTLIGFTGFSTNQELAKKIKKFVALAPVATLNHVRGAAKLLAETFVDCKMMEETFGTKGFVPNSDANRLIASSICSHYPFGAYFCQEIAFLIGGRHFFECNVTRYQVIFSQYPAGTSVQNAQHFCQMAHNNNLTWFDFGSAERNLQHYNHTTPPKYNVSNMTIPTYLFSGTNDFLASPQDVEWIVSKLPNVVKHTVMNGWNHMDFVWGTNTAPAFYKRIAALLMKKTKIPTSRKRNTLRSSLSVTRKVSV